MSSRTASSASMLEWMSETIAVRFMRSLRRQRLQNVQLHEVHLVAYGFGHPQYDIALEGQKRRRGRADAFPVEARQDPVAAHVDQLHLQPVDVVKGEDVLLQLLHDQRPLLGAGQA